MEESHSMENILADFLYALDEAIHTYKLLESIHKDDSKPNQLLYCHIVNNFDSLIQNLHFYLATNNNYILKKAFLDTRKEDEPLTIKDTLYIEDHGITKWMKDSVSKGNFEQDYKKKRHALKLEILLNEVDIDYKSIFVRLSGGIKGYESGKLITKATPKNKLTPNHKTTPENCIGYGDVLYEKRNAITHNSTQLSTNTISRLNQERRINIERKYVLVRKDTIKSIVRFYTSILQIITESKIIKDILGETISTRILKNLEKLGNLESIVIENKGIDSRYVGGGIQEREKNLLTTKSGKNITIDEYKEIFGIGASTANRDFKKYISTGTIQKKGREYKVKTI